MSEQGHQGGDRVASSGEEASVQTLACEAAAWFEYRNQTSREDDILTPPIDAPDWIRNLVYTAHGDWRYECIASALSYIHDNESDDGDAYRFADGQVNVYTGQRTAWLASNLNRVGYCDQAMSEWGTPPEDIAAVIGYGQYAEASEVYGLVRTALEERLAEIEDES